jgi:hypothetical protein
MFNKEYWEKKQARTRLANYSIAAMRMIVGAFWVAPEEVRQAQKAQIMSRKRTKKERLKRRQRHASMMRNHA